MASRYSYDKFWRSGILTGNQTLSALRRLIDEVHDGPDTATASNPADYAALLGAALEKGWEGFTGRVVRKDPAHPDGVPAEYVMQPYDVRLSYLGKPWCTVPVEIGHNEIGDAENADWVTLSDAEKVFARLGFPALEKVPLMSLDHQVAQKLHAVTDDEDRVRDLVDLQLIMRNDDVDLALTRGTCERLFAYRKRQQWPPVVTPRPGWDEQYAIQAEGLPVSQDVYEAAGRVNDFIRSLCNA